MLDLQLLDEADSESVASIATSLRRLVALVETVMLHNRIELPASIDLIAEDLALPDPPPASIRDEEAEAALEFLEELRNNGRI